MICHFSAPRQDKIRPHCLGKNINFNTHTHAHTYIYACSDFQNGFNDDCPEYNTESNITHATLSDLVGGKAYDLLLTYSALDASPAGVGKETGDF